MLDVDPVLPRPPSPFSILFKTRLAKGVSRSSLVAGLADDAPSPPAGVPGAEDAGLAVLASYSLRMSLMTDRVGVAGAPPPAAVESW